MQLRELNVGCFGGGTGLPSLLGGLKTNPWLRLNAVVTMFDSGGSSGQLRDELGVLPPGDVLKCALALARNEGEARRVLLSRLPTLEHRREAGRAHRRQPAAVDDGAVQRQLPVGRRRPARSARLQGARVAGQRRGGVACASSTATARRRAASSRSIWDRRQGQQIRRLWLEPAAAIHPDVAEAIRGFDAVIIGPGSFFTSLMPPLLVRGVKEALADVRGPVILIANLLTEGSGMAGFTAADAARWVSRAIERPIDVVIANTGRPSRETLLRYAAERKEPLEVGALDGEHRAGDRPVLDHRDRAPRSSPPVVRGLVGA